MMYLEALKTEKDFWIEVLHVFVQENWTVGTKQFTNH